MEMTGVCVSDALLLEQQRLGRRQRGYTTLHALGYASEHLFAPRAVYRRYGM